MKLTRRRFTQSIVAGAAVGSGRPRHRSYGAQTGRAYDVAVVGAGVFGAWTAWHLARSGRRVALLDAYGPGNSRSSSGGESRIIRLGYGGDELYTKLSQRSLEVWRRFFAETGNSDPPLFHPTGVLWLARERDPYALQTVATLEKVGAAFERLARAELERRYSQIALGAASWGVLEPGSGALLARRAVAAVAREAVRAGAELRIEPVAPPAGKGRLDALTTVSGDRVAAGTYVFACGPWLPKLFPDVLGGRIQPTRQEVFFVGVPAGERRFRPPAMPAWIDFAEEVYGIPDLEGRGFKIAFDRHGPAFDPDTGSRVVSSRSEAKVRAYVARRFPALGGAPIIETRVCQYENTSSGDFLVDRHPGLENVWLLGGGSGHGFKHGPAIGEYAAGRVSGVGAAEPRFSLATKGKVARRAVF